MIKKAVLFASLLAFSQYSVAQLTEINTGNDANLFDISFPSPDLGFIVGGTTGISLIFKTTDGGQNWVEYSNENTNHLYGVDFVNENLGFACGFGGVMYKTTDSGNFWSELNTNISSWIMNIDFVDANTGYGVCTDGVIIKTTDGGDTWVQQTSNTDNWLLSVKFTNPEVGFAIGISGTALKTTDGGATWNSFDPGTGNTLSDIYFVDENLGYITGFSGTLIRTTDGGNSWQALNPGVSGNLQSVHFYDANNGYVVGNGAIILKTEDGGDTWSTETAPTTFDLNEVVLTGNSVVMAADAGRIVVGDLFFVNTEDLQTESGISVFPNPTKDWLYFQSATSFSNLELEVFNLSGQRMAYESYQNGSEGRINLSFLRSGIYFIRVKMEDVVIQTLEIMKN